ncbi:hypothetical protein ABIE51_001407 [Lysobacter sp. OAE881]|uniref:hypothetical protein n=1 Tax=Lysobacter sp. OAE881 TaxID=2663813 RepID=UPI00178A7761
MSSEMRGQLADELRQLHDFAHDHSSGPEVPDYLWEVRNRVADILALLARTEAGADRPVAEIGYGFASNKLTFVSVDWGRLKFGDKLYLHPQDASGDAAMREALENSNSLLVAMLIEPRDRAEVEQQIADNRAAMPAKEAK